MTGVRRFFLAVVVSAIAALPANAQEAVNSISVSAHGGFISSPTAFDAGRSVEYSSGKSFGGGLALQLYERISIKGSASFTYGAGTDVTGGISEDVTLDRQFYGGGVEVLLVTGMSIEPYVYGGGGLVIIDRVGGTAVSYAYDVTEFTGVVGAGVRYLFDANAFVFVEGTNWIYNNAITDSAQNDSSLSVGLGYRWGGN